MARGYRPKYHKAVVDNYRDLWKQFYPNEALQITDNKIWAIFDDGVGYEPKAGDNSFPATPNRLHRYDIYVVAEMHQANQVIEALASSPQENEGRPNLDT